MTTTKGVNLFACPTCLWQGIDNRKLPARSRRCPQCFTRVEPVRAKRLKIDREARKFITDGCGYHLEGNVLRALLPMGPSNNTYWRRAANRVYLSLDANAYRRAIAEIFQGVAGFGDARLRMTHVFYARDRGAPAVEGYPVDNRGRKVDLTMAYVGTRGVFEAAGFTKAADTDAVSGGIPRVLMRRSLST